MFAKRSKEDVVVARPLETSLMLPTALFNWQLNSSKKCRIAWPVVGLSFVRPGKVYPVPHAGNDTQGLASFWSGSSHLHTLMRPKSLLMEYYLADSSPTANKWNISNVVDSGFANPTVVLMTNVYRAKPLLPILVFFFHSIY